MIDQIRSNGWDITKTLLAMLVGGVSWFVHSTLEPLEHRLSQVEKLAHKIEDGREQCMRRMALVEHMMKPHDAQIEALKLWTGKHDLHHASDHKTQ